MSHWHHVALALAVGLEVVAGAAAPAVAREECHFLRDPDIHGERIVFTHGGDLWTVSSQGGTATRLTSHPGNESGPHISPDGRTVAFTGEYHGRADVYTVPIDGGEPTRHTWHPGEDRMAAWLADGEGLLFRSARASFLPRFDQFYRVSLAGGFEQPLPLPTAGRASLSPDGRRLAYVAPADDRRTWKRYRGGGAPDVWIASLDGSSSERITDWQGSDDSPLWVGDTIYYLSDRGGDRVNLWACSLAERTHRQVTRFGDYDVRSAASGPGAIVLETGGVLYRLDLPGETPVRLQVSVRGERPATREAPRNVASLVASFDLSPRARRVAVEARGDIFSVPAEHGEVRNLTRTPGARERAPAWSPDGRWIAWLSDRSGEYEVEVAASDGSAPARQVTKAGSGFRDGLLWSPDGRRIAFADSDRTLWWCDVATGALHRVDRAEGADIRDYAWSPDSRHLAYGKVGPNALSTLYLHDVDLAASTRISDPHSDDRSPAFDPEGRWLWFISRRAYVSGLGPFDLRLEASARDVIAAVTLRKGGASPLPPRSDEEPRPEPETAADSPAGRSPATAETRGAVEEAGAGRIDGDGIAGRVTLLPVDPDRYAGLRAFSDRLLFVRLDNPDPERDPASEGVASILSYDLEERETSTVVAPVAAAYAVSADGRKVLYRAGTVLGILAAGERGRVGGGRIDTQELIATVDPAAEWRQIFHEAWRLERDFFHDPELGGLDWRGVRARYESLLPCLAGRDDLNALIGELLGELATSHAYIEGGDLPLPAAAGAGADAGIGLLGADFDIDPASGLYRFARIHRQRDASPGPPPPLAATTAAVSEGDLLVEVDGRALRPPENVHAAFAGTAGRPTRLTIAAAGARRDRRRLVVVPVDDESPFRYATWVHRNRDTVAAATAGRVAYVHLPDTAVRGARELVSQLYPQLDREALIVDVRFNSGGFPPEFLLERIAATVHLRSAQRDGSASRLPADGLDGPRCILANRYSGSAGEVLPLLFRKAGLGPVIGTRTWGALVGNSHRFTLVDGGSLTVPELGVWSREDGFAAENRGVVPDIEAETPPHLAGAGADVELEAAVGWCRERIGKAADGSNRPPPRRTKPHQRVPQRESPDAAEGDAGKR